MRTNLRAAALLAVIAVIATGCSAFDEKPKPSGQPVAASNCTPSYEVSGFRGLFRIAGFSQAGEKAPTNDDFNPFADGVVAGNADLEATDVERLLGIATDEINAVRFGEIEALPGELSKQWRDLELAAAGDEALELYLARNTVKLTDPSASAAPSASPSASPTPKPSATPKPSTSPAPTVDARTYGMIVVPAIEIEARIGSCDEDGDGEFLGYRTVRLTAFEKGLAEANAYLARCATEFKAPAVVLGSPYLPLDAAELAAVRAAACATAGS